MQIYGPTHVHGAQPLSGPHATRAPQHQNPTSPAGAGDRLDISEAGELAARVADVPDIREDLVARVRDQIESGRYGTAEQFDVAVDRLLDEIG
jgi:anti-sigma28 factor (negative regulator of flagellin synthesis)